MISREEKTGSIVTRAKISREMRMKVSCCKSYKGDKNIKIMCLNILSKTGSFFLTLVSSKSLSMGKNKKKHLVLIENEFLYVLKIFMMLKKLRLEVNFYFLIFL